MSVELRKAKKEDQLLKRRNLNIIEDAEPLSPTENNDILPISTSIEEIVGGMHSSDETIQLQATQACRKMLSREKNPPIDNMIQQGIVPRCIEFLDSHHKYGNNFLYYVTCNSFLIQLFRNCLQFNSF